MLQRSRVLGSCLALACLMLATAGCLDLPEIEYRTRHLEIGSDYPGPICRGTLDAWDAQVEHVEGVLGVSSRKPIEVYLVPDRVEELCDQPARGCYSRARRQIYAGHEELNHELVHAAAHELGRSDHFYIEGNAEDLTRAPLIFANTLPSSNLGLKDPDEIDLEAAAHFLRWLRLRYGGASVAALLDRTRGGRGPNHARSIFRKVIGRDFHEVEEEYYETAPEAYGSTEVLESPLMEDNAGSWAHDVAFDCRDSKTEGIDGEMWRRIRILVQVPGDYVFEVEAPAHARILLLQPDELEVGQSFNPWMVQAPIGAEWGHAPEPIAPGSPVDVSLLEGEYRLELRRPIEEALESRTRFALHRRLGP